MKRGFTFMLFLTLVLLAAVIAGCGEKGVSEENKGDTGEKIETTETQAAEEKTDICGKISDSINEICKPDIEIELKGSTTSCGWYKEDYKQVHFSGGKLSYIAIDLWKPTFINNDGSLKEDAEKISGNWNEGYIKSAKGKGTTNSEMFLVLGSDRGIYMYEAGVFADSKDICTKEQWIETAKKAWEIWQ